MYQGDLAGAETRPYVITCVRKPILDKVLTEGVNEVKSGIHSEKRATEVGI